MLAAINPFHKTPLQKQLHGKSVTEQAAILIADPVDEAVADYRRLLGEFDDNQEEPTASAQFQQNAEAAKLLLTPMLEKRIHIKDVLRIIDQCFDKLRALENRPIAELYQAQSEARGYYLLVGKQFDILEDLVKDLRQKTDDFTALNSKQQSLLHVILGDDHIEE